MRQSQIKNNSITHPQSNKSNKVITKKASATDSITEQAMQIVNTRDNLGLYPQAANVEI